MQMIIFDNMQMLMAENEILSQFKLTSVENLFFQNVTEVFF